MKNKLIILFLVFLSVVSFQNCAPEQSFHADDGAPQNVTATQRNDIMNISDLESENIPTKNQDPGLYSGLWIPPNTTNLIVADPSYGEVYSYIPGCLNQRRTETAFRGCAANGYFSDYLGSGKIHTVKMTYNLTLSIRFKTKTQEKLLAKNLDVIRLEGADGGNVPVQTAIWVSESPGGGLLEDQAGCYSEQAGSPTVLTGLSDHSSGLKTCKIKSDTLYYLNIKKMNTLGDAENEGVRYILKIASSHFQQ